MLSNHDSEGGERCSSDTGDGEKLNEAGNIVALADDFLLNFKLTVDIVQVTSSLEWVVAQS